VTFQQGPNPTLYKFPPCGVLGYFRLLFLLRLFYVETALVM